MTDTTYYINTYPDLIHPRINKEFILDLLNFCLHNSFITFNNHCYHQTRGCPMGAQFSPTYCDDVVLMWRDSYGDFSIIIAMFGTLDDNLKFIFDPISHSADFLYITITTCQGRLSTDIFHKDTDTSNYVPYKSNHPRHTKNNIPYCLDRRICGIVSEV